MPDETAEPLSDNAALNELVDTLTSLNSALSGRYDQIRGDGNFVLVGDGGIAIYLRAARATSIKTVVTNIGPNPCYVRENGVLCMVVPAGETKELPLVGSGPIKITCATGESASVAVATYTKA